MVALWAVHTVANSARSVGNEYSAGSGRNAYSVHSAGVGLRWVLVLWLLMVLCVMLCV